MIINLINVIIMKKAILAITGLFMLFSCSDETIQQNDKQTENTVLKNNSDGMTTNSIDPAIPYESPYDNQPCCSPVTYKFINNTNLELNFDPYISLSRFDGMYDSQHFSYNSSLFNSTNCPNLLVTEGFEYFELVRCNTINVSSYNSIVTSYWVQVPILGINLFTISNPTTSIEQNLLDEFGKIYSLDGEVLDPVNGNVVLPKTTLRFPFLPQGITDPNQLSGDWIQMPSVNAKTKDLWYHYETFEICVGNDSAAYPGGGADLNDKPSEIVFDYNGETYILKLYTTATDVVILLDYN